MTKILPSFLIFSSFFFVTHQFCDWEYIDYAGNTANILKELSRRPFQIYPQWEPKHIAFQKCEFLYASSRTNEWNRWLSDNDTVEPKYPLFTPVIQCEKIDYLKEYDRYSYWKLVPVPELEDTFEIEHVASGQVLTVRGMDREDVDSERYEFAGRRVVFTEPRNLTRRVRDLATFWKLCTPDDNYWFIKNYGTDEYLYHR
jgi:hypothetical protein